MDQPTILKLSNELLEQIFLWHFGDVSSCGEHYSWLNITEVCKLWHNVAESCPCLWSTIIIPGITSSFLKRSLGLSKTASLYVSFNDLPHTPASQDTPYTQLSPVLAEMWRIETLSLCIWDKAAYHEAFCASARPAPRLCDYTLGVNSPNDDAPMQAIFLDGRLMPRLEQVSLGGRIAPWTALATARTIRILRLELHYYRPSVPTLTELFNGLRNLPHLLDLDLTIDLFDFSGDVSPLTFSELQRLKLTVYAQPNWHRLLDNLVTPPNTSLQVEYTSVKGLKKTQLIQPVVSKLTGASTIGSPEPLVALFVRQRIDPLFAGGIVPFEVSSGQDDHWWEAEYDYAPEGRIFRLGMPLCSNISIGMLAALPLKDVQQLWLDVGINELKYKASPSEDVNTLMPSVTELHVRCETVFHDPPRGPLEDAIHILSKPLEKAKPGSYAWPGITALVIYTGTVPKGEDWVSEELSRLRDVIISRQNGGCARLTELHIYTYGPITEEMSAIFSPCADEFFVGRA